MSYFPRCTSMTVKTLFHSSFLCLSCLIWKSPDYVCHHANCVTQDSSNTSLMMIHFLTHDILTLIAVHINIRMIEQCSQRQTLNWLMKFNRSLQNKSSVASMEVDVFHLLSSNFPMTLVDNDSGSSFTFSEKHYLPFRDNHYHEFPTIPLKMRESVSWLVSYSFLWEQSRNNDHTMIERTVTVTFHLQVVIFVRFTFGLEEKYPKRKFFTDLEFNSKFMTTVGVYDLMMISCSPILMNF
jgi:hypothetical protein